MATTHEEFLTEAAQDYAAWIRDEYVPVEGVDYDPGFQPTDEDVAAMTAEFTAPSACPDCGSEDIGYEPADWEVGFLADTHYCNDCGWELHA